jgi:diguanylate cyclase (GGDEF)-like protein/PAS domain S-box-containing protein
LTGYTQDEVVGKTCSNNVLRHLDKQIESLCNGDCPLSETMELSESMGRKIRVETEAYLRHKDGHRMLVSIRAVPIRNAEGKITGAIEIFREKAHKEVVLWKMKQLEELALVDPLTRLANRRHTEANLQRRIEELNRYGWPFGVLYIDIDRFKKINDRYGHTTGDKVLKLTSLTLQNSLRPFDFLGRWGGEEFVAIVINVNEEQLLQIADRALRLLEQSDLRVEAGKIHVTVSMGATMAKPSDTLEELLERADQLMYQSKAAGRNRVSARMSA